MTDTWALAQVLRADAVVRDMARSGGVDNNVHLRSHGHHSSTIQSLIRRGEVTSFPMSGSLELTHAGWSRAYQSIRGSRT